MIQRHRTLLALVVVCSVSWMALGCGSGEKPRKAKAAAKKTESGAKVAKEGSKEEKSETKAAPTAEGWGTLVGQFVFDGTRPTPEKLSITKDQEVCSKHELVDESVLVDDAGGLANVVVYVRSKDVNVHPDVAAKSSEQPVLDNKNCQFIPHVLPVWLEQTILIKNSDPVSHNTNLAPPADTAVNPLIAADASVPHKFGRSQNAGVPVSCNIHPWMRAYVLPRENPYFAVSGTDGKFKIEKLPAGEIEFQAWHEKPGYVKLPDWQNGRFKLTIEPDKETDLGTIKIPASLFSM